MQQSVDELGFLLTAVVDVALFAQADEVVLPVPHEHRLSHLGEVDFVLCKGTALCQSQVYG